MPDRLETELKFSVQDPSALRAALRRLGAQAEGRHEEENIRLDDRQHSLTARKIVLRLRRLSRDGEAPRHLLTVKISAGLKDEFKTRREIELAVSDGPAMLAALAVLGYEPYWRYEKRREVYILGEVEADLDEVPCGWFLELEGPADGIKRMAHSLGLELADGLTLSYAEIFENVRAGMKLDVTDLPFEAFRGITVDPRFYRR